MTCHICDTDCPQPNTVAAHSRDCGQFGETRGHPGCMFPQNYDGN